MSRNILTFELVGGIGNQLFGYFAGIYAASVLETNLRLYLRPPLRGETAHGSSISSFNLKHEIFTQRHLLPGVERLLKTSILVLLTKSGLSNSKASAFSGIHTSTVLGADPKLVSIKRGTYVRGYFQTSEYFDALLAKGLVPQFSLRRESAWFHDLRLLIEKEKPITMHIRRGDYLDPQNDFIGALSPRYFVGALNKLRTEFALHEREVWIFSDEIEVAKEELREFDLGPVRWIDPPFGSDPAESLLLLSMGSGIVTSNSTFSWWAAKLSLNNAVVAPHQWLRNHSERGLVASSDWVTFESDWLTR